jgi:hypothetical protein
VEQINSSRELENNTMDYRNTNNYQKMNKNVKEANADNPTELNNDVNCQHHELIDMLEML